MLFPIAVDVPMSRWPWMNWVLMSAIGVVFLWQMSDPGEADRFILGIDGWALSWDGEPVDEHPLSWIVHLLMHVDVFHLAGNLVFMWVFGNAVCAKVGNLAYLALWTGGGILASITERLVHPESAILGASGAISVAVGFFVIFWAFNEVTIFYFIFITVTGTFSVSAWWVILAYAAFDLIGIISADGEAAYVAHLGGYAIGAPVAVLLLKTGVLQAEPHEMTLLDGLRRTGARSGRGGGAGAAARGGRGFRVRAPASAFPLTRRIHVHVGDGNVDEVMVADLLRRAASQPDLAEVLVSDDEGRTWASLSVWRKRHGL